MDEPNDLPLPHCAKFSYTRAIWLPVWMGTPWHPKDSLIVLFKECAISTKKKSHPKRNFDSAGKGMQIFNGFWDLLW